MKIIEITTNKQAFMPLLSLADDPQFISDYLNQGALFALYDGEETQKESVSEALKAACVVTDEGAGVFELQNIAVVEEAQHQGYGQKFLDFICRYYQPQARIMRVRTDEFTASFYEKCGFVAYKRVKNYFPEKYGHPVFDKGRELLDNIWLEKRLKMNETKEAVAALKAGHLAILPTETVYGLFADAMNQEAVERLYTVKGRPTEKALNLNIADPAFIHRFSKASPSFLNKLVENFLPGPLTLILKASDQVPDWVHVGKETIGFRMPAISATLETIKEVGVLVGPSANLTGAPSPRFFADLTPEILKQAAFTLQDDSIYGLDTTILDLTMTPAKILRQGAVTKSDIMRKVPEIGEIAG